MHTYFPVFRWLLDHAMAVWRRKLHQIGHSKIEFLNSSKYSNFTSLTSGTHICDIVFEKSCQELQQFDSAAKNEVKLWHGKVTCKGLTILECHLSPLRIPLPPFIWFWAIQRPLSSSKHLERLQEALEQWTDVNGDYQWVPALSCTPFLVASII